ncbi:hypothetical protein RFI_06534, partial [Reticulomyxa filosa]
NLFLDCPIPICIRALLFKLYYAQDLVEEGKVWNTSTWLQHCESFGKLSAFERHAKQIFPTTTKKGTKELRDGVTPYLPHGGTKHNDYIFDRIYSNELLYKTNALLEANKIGSVAITPMELFKQSPVDSLNMTVRVPIFQRPLVNFGVPFRPKRHYVSLCTMVTGDEYVEVRQNTKVKLVVARLKEWTEYHRMIGVEHFFIYDNSFAPYGDVYKLLIPLIQEGIVTYVYWPHRMCLKSEFSNQQLGWHRLGSQMSGHSHCLGHFGFFNEWIGVFDVDEFLIPPQQLLVQEGSSNHSISSSSSLPLFRMIEEWKYHMSDQVNFICYPAKMGYPCSEVGHQNAANSQQYPALNRYANLTILSRYQCVSKKGDERNKKCFVRTSQGRNLFIHHPLYTYPGFPLNVVNVQDNQTETEGYLFHARHSFNYDHIKRKELFTTPLNASTLQWMEKFHQKLFLQT